MNPTRRLLVFSAVILTALGGAIFAIPKKYLIKILLDIEFLISPQKKIIHNQISNIYLVKNGDPQENVAKVIEMMGGIEGVVGVNDIVVLKPNGQWWNQGRTNLAAMKSFIDLVLNMPNFQGEVIIAENHHFMDDSLPEEEKDNIRGWTKFGEINGEIDGVNHNLNTLIEIFQKQGYLNVTKSHWRDGGSKYPVWGNGQNGGIVTSPADGDGYIWTDDDYILEGLWGVKKWKVKMTYPIFTSSYSGITIDLKKGPYQRNSKSGGHYLKDRKLKFINFSALNDHGDDTGITGAIKNHMGVTDLSCGYWGVEPEGYVMVHECGSGVYPFGKAGPLGYFMKNIREADLNIITAEWVGWGSRTDITKATQMRTILASTDPVALDYYAAKNIIYPLSNKAELHDPDNPTSSVAKFLTLAQQTYGQGALADAQLTLYTHDFQNL